MALNNSINLQFPVSVAKGGIGVDTLAANGLLLGNGASAVSTVNLTDGQVLIGVTGSAPAASVLTAGAGISIDSVAGAVTITATNSLSWNFTSGTSAALVAENAYIAGNAALVTYTLPATAVVGDTFTVTTFGAGGWLVAQRAGQKMKLGTSDTTGGVTGSLASSAAGDTVTFVCVDATPGAEGFQVISSMGNITVA